MGNLTHTRIFAYPRKLGKATDAPSARLVQSGYDD
jgi:hypothetical protein